MEKLVYLCWKQEHQTMEAFRDELIGDAANAIIARGALSLTVNVADLGDPVKDSPLVLGEGRSLSASVSFWLPSLDARKPLEDALASRAKKLHGYLVTESVPLAYPDRTWPDGQRSPGVTLVTAFPKPERLTDEQFYGHWHGAHTPLSFEVHPLWRYLRHSVARALTPNAPRYRGIVEERFRVIEDVLDMERLFRGKAANMKRAMADVNAFLDTDQIDSALMSEYIIKS